MPMPMAAASGRRDLNESKWDCRSKSEVSRKLAGPDSIRASGTRAPTAAAKATVRVPPHSIPITTGDSESVMP